MSKESKIILLVAAVIVAAVGILIAFVNANQMDPATIMEKVVRENSRRAGSGSVQVVEFGDYQCPACAQSNPTVSKLKEEFEGKITFVYRNFPLPGHQNAWPSAEAAEAAGDQGKFWEMHDILYANQSQWSALADPTTMFAEYARELNLDIDRFTKSVTNKANKERISNDQSDGYAVGVSGTPTFFINGKRQSSFDYDSLKKAIEAELNQ